MMLVSAATLAQGQSANLPRYEFFAGYSVNADYIRNRLFLLALDQKALREICGGLLGCFGSFAGFQIQPTRGSTYLGTFLRSQTLKPNANLDKSVR
jgi:hypothetical protein